MSSLRFKRYLNIVSLGAILALVICKSVLRPWARAHEVPEFVNIILGSIPNFLEPLVGLPALTGILLMLRHDRFKALQQFSERGIYFLAVFLGAIYVITQELRLHNLGGNNIYDSNDLVASVIGLVFMLVLMLCYGFIKSETADSQSLSN